MEPEKHIVVLGAGFGGLRTALRIARVLQSQKLTSTYRVVLVDAKRYHTFTPPLYEIACTSSSAISEGTARSLITFPIQSLIKNLPITFIEDSPVRIDPLRQVVQLSSREIPYEHLVIALGSEPHYYGIDSLKAHALPLKTIEDALVIRNKLEAVFKNPSAELAHIVICGAGPTGVQLACEIKLWATQLLKKKRIVREVHVSLLEAHHTILPLIQKQVRARVYKRLASLGVHVMVKEEVVNVTDSVVTLKNGETLAYDALLWTGGVTPNKIVHALPFLKNEDCSLGIHNEFQCYPVQPDAPVDTHVYAIGDIASFSDPTAPALPAMARLAMTQADIVSDDIIALITNHPRPAPRAEQINEMDWTYIIPLGGTYAVTHLGSLVIEGWLAWVMLPFVALRYFMSIMPFSRALSSVLRPLRILRNHLSQI
jgi:NADH:ubiquinone reductase (H+-translocating)